MGYEYETPLYFRKTKYKGQRAISPGVEVSGY